MGIIEMLTVVFVTLKILGYIDWSWFGVFSPILVTWFIYAVLLFSLSKKK